MKFRNVLFGLGLGFAAFSTTALSLGNARGIVVLGKPIDLTFEVHVDPGMDLDGACTAAELVSGETPVGSGRVRITPLPQVSGRLPAVRVQASIIADEPVLTVKLAVGCSGKITRTYIFLAELPESVVASTAPIAIPVAALESAATSDARSGYSSYAAPQVARSSPQARSRPRDVAADSSPVSVQVSPRTARAPQARRTKPAALAVRKPVQSSPQAQVKPSQPEPSKARLVMEPLDAWKASPSVLRPSTELTAPQTAASEPQREQAAALWKALNAQPQEIQQDSARIHALDAELASMRSQAASDRAATLEVQQRLERMEAERYPASVVYGLFLLLAGALAGIAWMGWRVRTVSAQARRTWSESVARSVQVEPSAAEVDGLQSVANFPEIPSSGLASAETVSSQAAGQAQKTMLNPAIVAPAHSAKTAPVIEAWADAASVNVVHPEELFDLQQQAEFFVSVGEHDHAIDVMRKHIASNEKTSPLAYLELLRLYRSLSRVDAFNQLRTQFHRHFNAQVPEFAAFNGPGRTLLDYPDTLAQIEVQWTDPAVLPLLESLLFCRDDNATERFDLPAYDDLLLLHAIAGTTPVSARGAPPPRKRTTPQASATDSQAAAVLPVITYSEALHTPPAGLDNTKALDGSWILEAPVGSQALAHSQPLATPLPEILMDIDLLGGAAGAESPQPLPTPNNLPVAPAVPLPNQLLGPGANNDPVEVRFDLDEHKPG